MPKRPIIKFTQAHRLTSICNIVREGGLAEDWDGSYERLKTGTSTISIPQNGGTGLRVKSVPLKSRDTLPLDVSAVLDNEEALYLVTSSRYPMYYVGITSRGIEGVFQGGGRFSHHVRKMLASHINTGTNHTEGWRKHAYDRYRDLLSRCEAGASPSEEELLGDIIIAFGVSGEDWSSKDHEGVAANYFSERLSEIKGEKCVPMNKAPTAKYPAQIWEPENLESALSGSVG